MDFLETVIERAKQCPKTIVLPESDDPRTLQAADEILRRKIAKLVLVGDEKKIALLAGGLDLSQATIVNPLTSPLREDYVKSFYELRKAKGVTMEKADEIMRDNIFWAVMMVKKGEADGMVSGAAHSTADTVRPALQVIKTAPGAKIASSFFVMIVPDCAYGENGTFVFADCGLNRNPTADELAEIAIASAASFKSLVRAEPKVGMLSFSSYGSGSDPIVDKVIEATRIAKERAPELTLDGELQADAALVPAIGEAKAKGSKVAGHANVLVFPDLNCGNIAYKLVQRLGKAKAFGPILQGIAKPVNDLSRGCSASDIVGVVAITAVQAQNGTKQ